MHPCEKTQNCCGATGPTVSSGSSSAGGKKDLPKSLALTAAYADRIWEFPKIGGTLFWGPCNKDPTI